MLLLLAYDRDEVIVLEEPSIYWYDLCPHYVRLFKYLQNDYFKIYGKLFQKPACAYF